MRERRNVNFGQAGRVVLVFERRKNLAEEVSDRAECEWRQARGWEGGPSEWRGRSGGPTGERSDGWDGPTDQVITHTQPSSSSSSSPITNFEYSLSYCHSDPPTMTRIDSLPAELIRHALSLAYPAGERGSGQGLSQTSLVHSSWREPSQSIMTEKLEFSLGERNSAFSFVETGPLGYSSDMVVLSQCPAHLIPSVIAKAKAGAISALELVWPDEDVTPYLFRFSGLSGQHKSMTNYCC